MLIHGQNGQVRERNPAHAIASIFRSVAASCPVAGVYRLFVVEFGAAPGIRSVGCICRRCCLARQTILPELFGYRFGIDTLGLPPGALIAGCM